VNNYGSGGMSGHKLTNNGASAQNKLKNINDQFKSHSRSLVTRGDRHQSQTATGSIQMANNGTVSATNGPHILDKIVHGNVSASTQNGRSPSKRIENELYKGSAKSSGFK
jgi:hypothetical protein